MWVGTERRSDLKEEASDLKRLEVAAKTQERERERYRHKIELLLSRVGPYKLGIYTPKLGYKPFRHITNMTRPLIDIVNTAIRCPHSTTGNGNSNGRR
jgi:hypothetical protein